MQCTRCLARFSKHPKRRWWPLTPAEISVIAEKVVRLGRRQKDVAAELGISISCVKDYAERIRDELGLPHPPCGNPSRRNLLMVITF